MKTSQDLELRLLALRASNLSSDEIEQEKDRILHPENYTVEPTGSYNVSIIYNNPADDDETFLINTKDDINFDATNQHAMLYIKEDDATYFRTNIKSLSIEPELMWVRKPDQS